MVGFVAKENLQSYVITRSALPAQFPTQAHDSVFWESLGRVVATFGFLEEVLAKAIFSFTATTPYPSEEIDDVFAQWVPKLERALSDPLGGLIDSYGKAVRDNPHATISNLDSLLDDLRDASYLRNVLCHGSWRTPDSDGRSTPFFINRKQECFDTAIDASFLNQVQKHCTELICTVIDTVTHMGWQFPGSTGPGEVIWSKNR